MSIPPPNTDGFPHDEWIGRGLTIASVPRNVNKRCTQELRAPEEFRWLIPSQTSVATILNTALVPDILATVPRGLSCASFFQKGRPAGPDISILSLPLLPSQFLAQLANAAHQTWLNGQELFDPRTKQLLPLWVVSLWQAIEPISLARIASNSWLDEAVARAPAGDGHSHARR